MSEAETGGGWNEPRTEGAQGASPKEMVAGAAQTLKQEAATFAEDARGRASEKIEQHKQTTVETFGDFANAIRKAGDELAGADQSMAARMVRQAADGLESFARSVSDKRPEELIDAVRDFGRRNPTAFIAGSVLAGVALGRFMKSSGSSSSTQRLGMAPAGAPAASMVADEDLAAINGDAISDIDPGATGEIDTGSAYPSDVEPTDTARYGRES